MVEDGTFPTLDTKANQPGIADGVAAYRRWGITRYHWVMHCLGGWRKSSQNKRKA